jgi:hypothetical protein
LAQYTIKINTPQYRFKRKIIFLTILRKLQDSWSKHVWVHTCSRFNCSITIVWVIKRAKSKPQVKKLVSQITFNLAYELWIFFVFLNSPHYCASFDTLQVLLIVTPSRCNKKWLVHRYWRCYNLIPYTIKINTLHVKIEIHYTTLFKQEHYTTLKHEIH